jgi:hypothetical protein
MVGLGGMTASDGTLVAWGPSDVQPDYRPVAVRSTDGSHWQAASIGKADSEVWDLADRSGGLVAVGSGPYCCEAGAEAPIRAWTSPDGATWASAEFQPVRGKDQLELVVSYGGRFVALGTYAGMPISWLSDDGTIWTEADSVPDAAVDEDPCTGGPCPNTTVSDLTGGQAGLVAVGRMRILDSEGAPIGWQSVVWIAPAVAK